LIAAPTPPESPVFRPKKRRRYASVVNDTECAAFPVHFFPQLKTDAVGLAAQAERSLGVGHVFVIMAEKGDLPGRGQTDTMHLAVHGGFAPHPDQVGLSGFFGSHGKRHWDLRLRVRLAV
jgi:hypothetical protein